MDRRVLNPPTSPLARFPSPFTEENVDATQQLLSRTFSAIGGASFATISDRVGAAYSPTAQGLTMKRLTERVRDGLTVAREQALKAASAASGPALLQGSGSPSPFGPMSPTGSSSANSFPKPMTVVSVPRRKNANNPRLAPLSSPQRDPFSATEAALAKTCHWYGCNTA